MQNVMHIAPNAGHTAENDGQTMQNDGRTMHNVGRNTLNVCQGPKGGLRSPPGDPSLPLYLKKTLVSRNAVYCLICCQILCMHFFSIKTYA